MTTSPSAWPSERLVVDVWSDIVCPFCYMGERLLAQALERFPHAPAVEVRYHSFQLMPHLSSEHAMAVDELLVREKGIPRAQAEALHARVAARGKEIGLDYRFDKALAVNTRAAHRLSHFARREGKQHALIRRLFRAYFSEGLHLGKHEVLADLAAEVGLPRAAALEALESGAFEDDVVEDEQQARAIGIRGVPFFILDREFDLSGAQPVEMFLRALDAAWAARLDRDPR